jgi:hypothetical protein
VLGLAAGATRGGDNVVSREAEDGDAGGEEAPSQWADVWTVSHRCRGGLGWDKNYFPLFQIRFLDHRENSPPRGLNSACHRFSAQFPLKPCFPKRGLKWITVPGVGDDITHF